MDLIDYTSRGQLITDSMCCIKHFLLWQNGWRTTWIIHSVHCYRSLYGEQNPVIMSLLFPAQISLSVVCAGVVSKKSTLQTLLWARLQLFSCHAVHAELDSLVFNYGQSLLHLLPVLVTARVWVCINGLQSWNPCLSFVYLSMNTMWRASWGLEGMKDVPHCGKGPEVLLTSIVTILLAVHSVHRIESALRKKLSECSCLMKYHSPVLCGAAAANIKKRRTATATRKNLFQQQQRQPVGGRACHHLLLRCHWKSCRDC